MSGSTAMAQLNQPNQSEQPNEQEQPYLGHREACDECHQRKVRCMTEGGPCRNCIAWGKACIYSPKVPVGRPRKRRSAGTGAAAGATTSGSFLKPTRTMSTQEVPRLQAFDNFPSYSANVSIMEPDLVSGSSSSASSLASQYGMLPQAQDYMHMTDQDTNNGVLFMSPYDLNYGTMPGGDFTSMLADDTLPVFPKARPAFAIRQPVQQTIIESPPLLKSSSHDRLSRPQSRQEPQKRLISPKRQGHHHSKETRQVQHQLGSTAPTSTPVTTPLTFNLLLNSVMDFRNRRDALLTSLSSVNNGDAFPLPPTDMAVTFQCVSSFCDSVEPYVSTLVQQTGATSGISSASSSSLSSYHAPSSSSLPSPISKETQMMTCLIISACSFIIDIFRAFVDNVSDPSSTSSSSNNKHQRQNGDSNINHMDHYHHYFSPSHPITPTSGPLPDISTFSSRLSQILHLATLDFYLIRTYRSLTQISKILNLAEVEGVVLTNVSTEELSGVADRVRVLREDVGRKTEVLRTPPIGASSGLSSK